MDLNNISVTKDSLLPINVRILLIDHNATSLVNLASKFEHLFYKVTTAASPQVALILLRGLQNHYNVVIVDRNMPEMEIYEFVHEIRCQTFNSIPIILIDENSTTDSGREAVNNGVCLVFQKPLSDLHISRLCQGIERVTGLKPSHIDVDKYVNPDNGNLKRNIINPDSGTIKRTKNQIGVDSNPSFEKKEDVGRNSKKSRMTWNPRLHEKFLKATEILGEKASPKMLLSTMNEPDLTYGHVKSYLQKHRNKKRNSINLERSANHVMPRLLPASSLSIIAKGGVCIPEGSGGVQMPYRINQNHSANAIFYPNIQEQVPVFPRRFGIETTEGNPEILGSRSLSIGLPAPNLEPAGPRGDLKLSTDLLSYGLQAPNRKAPGDLANDVVIANGHEKNVLHAPNKETAGDNGIGRYGLGYVVNPKNMNNHNFEEGSGANQPFYGMPSEDKDNNLLQEAAAANFWDCFSQI